MHTFGEFLYNTLIRMKCKSKPS